MSRPKKKRLVHLPPLYTAFKPVGYRQDALQSLPLRLDEFEAIRLADYLGLEHSEAAEMMEISRSTFSRLIEKARKKVAQFLIEGRYFYIEGGDIHFRENVIRCSDCGLMFKTSLESSTTACPSCNSPNVFDLAGGFGHGKCCQNRKRKNRR